MKKEKKISVIHFQNEQKNKVMFAGKEIHPVYFRIRYDRKKATFKSKTFSEINSTNLSYSKNLYISFIDKDRKVVEQIIKRVKEEKGKFDLETFKYYYQYYSTNVVKKFNDNLNEEIFKLLIEKGFIHLTKILQSQGEKLTYSDIVVLIREVNSKLYEELDYALKRKLSFLRGLSYILFWGITEFEKEDYLVGYENVKIEPEDNPNNIYIPLIDWVNASEIANKYINQIAALDYDGDIGDPTPHVNKKIQKYLHEFYESIKKEAPIL